VTHRDVHGLQEKHSEQLLMSGIAFQAK